MFLNLAQYLEKRMRKGSFFIKTDDCKIEPLKIPDELIAIHPENYSRLFSFKSIFIETNRFYPYK